MSLEHAVYFAVTTLLLLTIFSLGSTYPLNEEDMIYFKTDLFQEQKSKYYSPKERKNGDETEDLETAQVVFRPLFRYRKNVAIKIANNKIYQGPVRKRLARHAYHYCSNH